MIDIAKVLGIARAELRLIRRLVRYWIFLTLSVLVNVVIYLYCALFYHRILSTWSASSGSLSPRFIVGGIGLYPILIFCIGLVFLSFDLRARDRRDRIVEVLDARPYSNLELLCGRFLGQLLSAWIPLAVVWAGLVVLGKMIGSPLQPLSVVALLTYMAIPAFAFTIGLTYLVTILVRHRLVACVLTLVLLIGQFIVMFFSTIRHVGWFDMTGGYMIEFPSDLLLRISDWSGYTQRLGVLAAAFACLALTAALHPRLDQRKRTTQLGAGAALAVAAVAMLGLVSGQRLAVVERLQAWRTAHESVATEQIPDVVRVAAEVNLSPGRQLDTSASVTVRPLVDAPLRTVALSLNPGLLVSSVTGADAQTLEFTQRDGLLLVDLPAPVGPGEEATLHVESSGLPVIEFGYIDCALNIFEVELRRGGVFLLGYDNGFFRRRYAALMPGLRWLPDSGPSARPRGEAVLPRDLYELELDVTAPDSWTLAGPGRRTERDGVVRFAPPAPVPGAALVGGTFVGRQIEVDGIVFEILLLPSHAGVLDTLAEVKDELESAIGSRLEDARRLGLDYPYDAMTLVEVPTSLRSFGGGWRMDTTLAPPAMLLIRESGLPTARFDLPFKNRDRFKDKEGGVAQAMRERLETFFEYDLFGANLFIVLPKNFLGYQVTVRGPDTVPLDALFEMLSIRLLSDRSGYFSANILDPELSPAIQESIISGFASDFKDYNFAESLTERMTNRSEVWEALLDQSLTDLDPWEDPQRSLDALVLKTGAMADAIIDQFGREWTGRWLARLRQGHAGRALSREDLVAAAGERAEDLRGMLDLWLDETSLPGFVIEGAEAFRLEDSEDGTPRYQLAVAIRNDEPVPGLLRLVYDRGQGDDRRTEAADPVKIEGRSSVRVGIVTSAPVSNVRVDPYMSLNRQKFSVELPAVDEERIERVAPFRGVESIPWSPPATEELIVDDLDDGFEVVDAESRWSRFRVGLGTTVVEEDQGLPVLRLGAQPSRWSRISVPEAHGRYRHTAALVMTRGADSTASWSAEAARSAPHTLEIFLPPKSALGMFSGLGRGTWALEISDSSGSQRVSFDADAAVSGWNEVGTFELAAGEVTVELAMEEGGRVLLADAIKLSPARPDRVESR